MNNIQNSSQLLDDGGTDRVFDFPKDTALPSELALYQAKEGYLLFKTHKALVLPNGTVTRFIFRYVGMDPHNLNLPECMSVIRSLEGESAAENAYSLANSVAEHALGNDQPAGSQKELIILEELRHHILGLIEKSIVK